MQGTRAKTAMIALIGRLAREQVPHHFMDHGGAASGVAGGRGLLQVQQALQRGQIDIPGQVLSQGL